MAKWKMSVIGWIAFVLLVIGGLNWGLAVFDYNLVTALLGTGIVTKVVYGLVGLAAVYKLIIVLIRK